MSYDGAPILESEKLALPAKQFGVIKGFDAAQIKKMDVAFEAAFRAMPTVIMDATVLNIDGALYRRIKPAAKKFRNKLHHWASVGKMVTALGIMVLKEKGRLKLSDPISKYVSGVPEGNLITIEMLLNHTSGLYSANEDPKVRASNQLLSLSEEIAILNKHGNLFCPGTNWRYSNSGYSLLAEVIKQISGQSYADFITRQVISKTTAKHIRVMSIGERPSDVVPFTLANGTKVAVINHFSGAGSVIADAGAWHCSFGMCWKGVLFQRPH